MFLASPTSYCLCTCLFVVYAGTRPESELGQVLTEDNNLVAPDVQHTLFGTYTLVPIALPACNTLHLTSPSSMLKH